VGPAPPQQLQRSIGHAAQIPKERIFPKFHFITSSKVFPKKFNIFLDKQVLSVYNEKADFGGAEIL
jgi:hypothetical protein